VNVNALETITIRPDPASWKFAQSSGDFVSTEMRATFRAEMNLPEGPIIMSGHQAEWWHAGILAKYLATSTYARKVGATAAWVVVDQDTGAPESLKYPGQRWSVRRHAFSTQGDEFRPLCERSAIRPSQADCVPLCPAVAQAISELRASLDAYSQESSLARQVMKAMCEHSILASLPMRQIFASRLNETSLFKILIERMMSDPKSCVQTYNEAVHAVPQAKMRKLREGVDPELPLWSISEDGVRTATRMSTASGRLLPRALMMTAMLRMAGCELFIHGLGGGVYDIVTELWMKSWLGIQLAPMTVVSATRYARPEGAPAIVSREEAIEALRRSHRAHHHPSELGEVDAEKWRTDIVARIARATGAERNALYRVLQTWLKAYRERNEDRLRSMSAEARRLQIAARAGAGAFDRTWPFMFLSSAQLMELRNEVELAFERAVVS